MRRGKLIEEMTWSEAEGCLNKEAVIVIPLGAAAKEHGLHLQLRNDWLIAEYLKEVILKQQDVIILPTINYSYYPAFSEYPGSVSLSAETSANMIYEICQSIAKFGVKKFYVLNTGISTLTPLKAAAQKLKNHGLVLQYTNLHEALDKLIENLAAQDGGSHADEIETSIMLHIAPDTVCMDKARHDYIPGAQGHLIRTVQEGAAYSPSGVWGDATLATQPKGEKIVECLIKHIINDLDNLKQLAVSE